MRTCSASRTRPVNSNTSRRSRGSSRWACVLPKDAPTRETVAVRFEKGRPVAIKGKKVNAFQAIQQGNALGGKDAVGIATHLVGNRFVGIKSRGVYEAPGMELLGNAYAYLLQLVLDRRARELFDQLSLFVAKQIYQGYGFDLATHMARAAVAPVNALATGTIKLKLYKGRAEFVSAEDVPHQMYSEAPSMEAIGSFDHADSVASCAVPSGCSAPQAWAGRRPGLTRRRVQTSQNGTRMTRESRR